ncbi:2059_t:CDS:2 [Funneliformis geosporum]|uniref:2059_t:CDS:1 n=1 Tax=Funneliformis geosporum TaxID=1117311 RepID=A0A9W4SAK4_9GLOM|nr:2059_t:CDS:2 [Funneliformis geosporum]
MAARNFSSIKEELEHYKARTAALEATLLETQAGMEEFQTTSRELEEDLERELEQSEKRYKDLKLKNEALKSEVDEWKLDSLRSLQEKFVIKTRELEIDFDDLERTERAAKSSLIDLENKYNKAIERNVILENELEGKNHLIVQVQRLKDDLRDVHIELAILKNKQDGEYGPPPPSSEPVSPPRKEIYNPPPPQTKPTIMNLPRSEAMNTQINSDPNSNPVKMVQEMVGRVKSLEARLVSCRSLVTPLLAPPPSYSTTMPLASNSPPPSPKARMDSTYRTSLKSYRRSSLQKSKAFSMSVNQIRSKVQ